MSTLPISPATLPGGAAPDTTRPLDIAALLGPSAWARLPLAVRRRFAAAHADVEYVGRLDLRCSRIGRLHAWLTRPFASPLLPLNATGVPASVRVYGNGRGGVVWERLLGAGSGHAACKVRSTKEPGPDGGLEERADGGLGMALEVSEQGGDLVFRSRRFSLAIGRWRLPIPALLAPGTCQVTHTDLGGGRFRFTLSMRHALWGETFHQSGVFTDPVERN